MNIISELKRRNVIRMAGLYLVGAWLITQVAGTVLPMFGAPGWIARSVVILLVIGFIRLDIRTDTRWFEARCGGGAGRIDCAANRAPHGTLDNRFVCRCLGLFCC